jgi:YfiH family protein
MTNIVTSEVLSRFSGVRFAMSTRNGGASPEPLGMNLSFKVNDDPANVRLNREKFFGGLSISANDQAFPHQCHSTSVLNINHPGEYEACDGLVTVVPSLWLTISIADCVPIMMFDTKKKVVAAIHAGWRGTVGRVVRNGVHLMRSEFSSKPSDLVVYIGPSAGACCYEVGEEVAEQFSRDVLTRVNSSFHLDLKKENKSQLVHEGVLEENIELSSSCTICSPKLFHSYRRDKEHSGRMMAVIGLSS